MYKQRTVTKPSLKCVVILCAYTDGKRHKITTVAELNGVFSISEPRDTTGTYVSSGIAAEKGKQVQVLTCVCVVLHYYSYDLDRNMGMLVTGTFVGYLIIFAGAAAGYILETPSDKRIDIVYSIVGVVLFVASGAVLINRYQSYFKGDTRTYNLAKGYLSIINGVILLIDAVLTQRGE